MEKVTVNKYRTIDNGSLRLADAGKTVKLAGWVDAVRKLGGLTFITLRDTYGKTQVVLNKEFIEIGKEDVISVENINNGIYFLKVIANGEVTVNKVVIQ